MTERLQKILSARGLCSRRKAEELIRQGRVTCNGQVCLLGQSADPDRDRILVDGKPLPSAGAHTYLMLHKPRGYVTTMSDEKGRPNAYQLVADCGKRVYPVGRLDMDSEGLLLFTDDGEFANHLMHPSHEITKLYRVMVKNYSEEALERVSQPIVLDGYRIHPPKVALRSESQGTAILDILIHEGRNRQVRRMCAQAGMTVIRLVRLREGEVRLGKLPAGSWRMLTEEEIASLRK